MADEKKIKNEEITDGRLNDAASGIGEIGWSSDSKNAPLPDVRTQWNRGDTLCPTCRRAKDYTMR